MLATSDRGGIRIQYSKNPFGRRAPLGADEGLSEDADGEVLARGSSVGRPGSVSGSLTGAGGEAGGPQSVGGGGGGGIMVFGNQQHDYPSSAASLQGAGSVGGPISAPQSAPASRSPSMQAMDQQQAVPVPQAVTGGQLAPPPQASAEVA